MPAAVGGLDGRSDLVVGCFVPDHGQCPARCLNYHVKMSEFVE